MPDDDLVYERVLPAPPATVFACLTDPAHLAAFWGPAGTTSPVDGIVVEPRPGGRFETLIVNDRDGTTHHMRALFDRVEAPNLLSWTEIDTGMASTVTLRAAQGGTAVRITQRHVPESFRSPAAREGFATSLDRLDRYLRTRAGKDS